MTRCIVINIFFLAHLFDVLARGNPQPYGYSTVGGMQPNAMKAHYGSTPIVLAATMREQLHAFGLNDSSVFEGIHTNNGPNRLTSSPDPVTTTPTPTTPGGVMGSSMPALELDHDMSLIRQAEIVLLKEEEKFGRHCRDLQGRLVPVLQVCVSTFESIILFFSFNNRFHL